MLAWSSVMGQQKFLYLIWCDSEKNVRSNIYISLFSCCSKSVFLFSPCQKQSSSWIQIQFRHTLPPQCACHLNTERDEQTTFIIPIHQPIGWLLIRLMCQPVSETTIGWLYGGNWIRLLASQSNVYVHYKWSCVHLDCFRIYMYIMDKGKCF